MRYPKREIVEQLRHQFPKGTRVAMVHMEDIDPVPTGTRGTVLGVNGLGDIDVAWDNGRSLSVVYGKDCCRLLPKEDVPETFCFTEGSLTVIGERHTLLDLLTYIREASDADSIWGDLAYQIELAFDPDFREQVSR